MNLHKNRYTAIPRHNAPQDTGYRRAWAWLAGTLPQILDRPLINHLGQIGQIFVFNGYKLLLSLRHGLPHGYYFLAKSPNHSDWVVELEFEPFFGALNAQLILPDSHGRPDPAAVNLQSFVVHSGLAIDEHVNHIQ